MKRRAGFRVIASAAGAASLGLLMLAQVPQAHAARPAATSLAQAVTQGRQIFDHDKFGGVRTCASCHDNGGTTLGHLPNGTKLPSLMGVAAQFPKYKAKTHRVVTLEQQLIHCITGGLRGKAPPATSPTMTDLVAYLTKLSKGSVMGQQFK